MSKKKEIRPDCKCLILAEGKDDYNFFIWALEAYNINCTQVFNYEGISKLKSEIMAISNLDGFDNIEHIIVSRDADNDSSNAFSSIKDILKTNDFPYPENAFKFTSSQLKIAIIIFPGLKDGELITSGTLEDLCLDSIHDNTLHILEKSNSFVNEINGIAPISHLHKSKLHTYLSVQQKYIGMKIGEAAKAGAWDWNCDAMIPFKTLLLEAS